MTRAPTARDVVAFWLGDSVASPAAAEAQRERWYRGGPDLDAEIVERFGPSVAAACAGNLGHWERSPEGALGLVILLDQFTRNVHRGTPAAYAGDARARQITDRAVAAGHDRALPVTGCIFLYHPYHHSERLADQDRALTLLEALERASSEEWRPYVRRSIEGFGRHRDIVARFGRFPHRNRLLGRESTPEEVAFLEADGERFGQGEPAG